MSTVSSRKIRVKTYLEYAVLVTLAFFAVKKVYTNFQRMNQCLDSNVKDRQSCYDKLVTK